jgi:hypothetical protein
VREVRQVAESDDRLEEALAAYLDYLEMGGAEPDTSHLSDSERNELKELIAALKLTEGVAFGLGRRDEAGAPPPAAPQEPPGDMEGAEQSRALVAQLRAALSPEVRIESDAPPSVSEVGGVQVVAAWVVGTFGGRVKVWLLAVTGAPEIEQNTDCLSDLNGIFRMSPDTAAIALVGNDLSCLVVQPEDTGPQIHVPSGSLVGRRYRRSIQPVGEAVSAFLDELSPYWDPVPAFDQSAGLNIDLSVVSEDAVTTAVENQRNIGGRARKGNPKKDALLDLGGKEITALTKLAKGLFEGSVEPEHVGETIEKLAKNR